MTIHFVLLSLLCSKLIVLNVICVLSDLIACQDRNMGNLNTKIVDVGIGWRVQLVCSYCNEEDDYESKIWYFKKRGVIGGLEEIVTIETEKDAKKIAVTPAHTLILKKFDRTDSGIYRCKHYKREDKMYFTYVLDGVFDRIIETKVGTINEWHEYKRYAIDPINEKISKTKKDPFYALRGYLKFFFKINFIWENNTNSYGFGRHTGKRKIAKCRLHPTPIIRKENITMNNLTAYYIYDNYDVPCRSIKLNETFPEISRIVRSIPEYELIDKSEKNLILGKSNIVTKKKINKRNTTKVLENGHIMLVCPYSGSDSEIKWFKNNKLLNNSFRNNMADHDEEPHITIDSYNYLQLLHITNNEEGSYKCVRGSKTMQKWYLEVVSNNKLLNEEFIRYSIYLGFVLSLTISCYCAGVCVAWHRRASFADPLNIYTKKKYSHNYSDLELLK